MVDAQARLMVASIAPDKTGMEKTKTDDAKTEDRKPEVIDGSRETVLIAEDSLPNQKILQHLLVKLGYDVVACNNGAEAWDKLHDPEIKNFVAILSDMMMPELDGLSLLKKVRDDEKFKTIPFVFISAISDKDQIITAKALKVNGYILKPVTFQKVLNKMKELFPQRIFPKVAA